MTRNTFNTENEGDEPFDELLKKADERPYKLKIDELNPATFDEPGDRTIDFGPPPGYEHMHEWEIRAHEERTEAMEPPGPTVTHTPADDSIEVLQKRAAGGSVTAQHQLDILGMRAQER